MGQVCGRNSGQGDASTHNAPTTAIDNKLSVKDDLFFVALAENEVIGTVLAGYEGHRGWLYSVAVHPAHRRRGLGASALTERGCMKINLRIVSTDESVKTFYEALGYSIEPRLSMGKKIEANIPMPKG